MSLPQNGNATADPLVLSIATWMRNNYANIQGYRGQAGGWEGWAQGSLKLHLDPAPGQPHRVDREQVNIWQNTVADPAAATEKIDLWISSNAAGRPNIGIELKCRKEASQTYTGETSSQFRARFLADCQKIVKPLQAGRVRAGTVTAMYAFGMTTDITDTNNYIVGVPGHGNVYYYTINAPTGWTTGQIYLMWYQA